MDSFKEFLGSKRNKKIAKTADVINETHETKKNSNSDEKSKNTKCNNPVSTTIVASKILQESDNTPTFSSAPKSGFIGSFNYIPDPSLFTEGAEYRNKSNGTVYKKVGNLWEEYIRDGKNGAQGMSVGGGCGVNEVKLITNQMTSETQFLMFGQTEAIVSGSSQVKSMVSDFNSIFLYAEGPSTSSYSATVKFYTIVDGVVDLVATSNLTNTSNKDNAQILTSNKVWFATLDINSGTVPAPGILAKVMR